MQKFIRVNAGNTDEINCLLESGWKVLDFKPIAPRLDRINAYSTCAYVLLEKN